MIFTTQPYDPSETEERPRSAYLSRKDVRIGLVGTAILAAALTPIYVSWERKSHEHLCTQNFAQISKALNIYLEANNDRFPPIFDEDLATGEPALINGYPSSWMTKIYSGMERRASFKCPAAKPEELAKNLNPESVDGYFESSYGMYRPWSGFPKYLVANPDTAIIVAETSNGGSNGTFNPIPYANAPDGIVIGWNDSNDQATEKTTSVTRLAFYDTKNGEFKEKGPARHEMRINVLFISGSWGRIEQTGARVQRLGEGRDLTGYWATP